MRRLLPILLVFLTLTPLLNAQPGFYIPGNTRVKDMQKALQDPEQFALLLQFSGRDTSLTLSHLDWLDSAYGIAFDMQSQRFYTMRVEAFAADSAVGQAWADAVVRYFARRSRMPFPVRYAVNPIHCACMGDTTELVRYEVPMTVESYNYDALPESRRVLNKTVTLKDAVLLTFTHNPDASLGAARGCYVPAHDSTIHGYYTELSLKKGALYSVDGTKDSCPSNVSVTIEEHLDYRAVVERYFLIPHKRNILVQSGYVVLHTDSLMPVYECRQALPDSITIQLPATQEQWDSKVRFFAKRYTDKGVEYRSLATKKVVNKKAGTIHIKAAINLTQFDTIFLGKRIKESELDDFFYEVDNNRDVGAFTVGKKHYVAYRMDRHGEYEMKKDLRRMFRIVEEEEDPEPTAPTIEEDDDF